MMNAELSSPSPPPPRGDAVPAPREAPCAGLFGWRKDRAAQRPEKDDAKRPGRDYPAG
ncbi:hypothetical protein [Sphingopyxis sp. FD7]|jgi:hypothetical protein|uniref:hypothetical protein n=1 Tax=Sphingopyxis sp. FD7 TaxID=1914525 RepID=UPI001559E432|nr:hypothetical protein [Sphingopyxis sp. FD7]